MDNLKAKAILAVYRSNGQDAQDPLFADALQQAERDPSLRGWLAEQQRFDAEFAAALGNIHGPRDGRALIEATTTGRAGRGRRLRWWPVALAASLALLFALYFGIERRTPVLALPANASLAELAANLSEHHSSLGLMSPDYQKLRTWIAERGGPLPGRLPPALTRLAILGCQTWETNRGRISLLCFVRDDKEMVHLYIFDDPSDGPPLPAMNTPRYEQLGAWSLALWEEQGRTYVLGMETGAEGEEALRALLRA